MIIDVLLKFIFSFFISNFIKKVFLIVFISSNLCLFSQTVIPLRKEGYHYYITCKINGKEVEFLFDTGASSVLITESIFKELLKDDYLSKSDIKSEGEAEVASGEIFKTKILNFREFDVSGIIINDVRGSVIVGTEGSLLLGMSAIKHLMPYVIDDSSSTLTVINGFNNQLSLNGFSIEEVVFNNGITLFKNTMEPVNGMVFSLHENGELNTKFYYKKGLKDSLNFTYYDNGQLREEANFTNGIQDLTNCWYKDGQLKIQSNYSMWKHSYQLDRYKGKRYKNTYHKNGKLSSKIVEQVKGLDTLFYQTNFYDNGQKESEGYYSLIDSMTLAEIGVHYEWHQNGNIFSETFYKNGFKDSLCKFFDLNGNLEKEIFYLENFEDNSSLETPYPEGLKTGYIKTYYVDGKIKEFKSFRNWKLHGKYEYFSENGELLESGNYLNGLEDGQFTWSSGNIENIYGILFPVNGGAIFNVNFKEGKYHGLFKMSYPWGFEYETTFSNGNGQIEYFYKNGIVSRKELYENGLLNGLVKEWYKDGVLKNEINYLDGKKNGDYKSYYPYKEIKIKEKGYYKDDNKYGTWTVWEPNGLIEMKSNYINDKLDGVFEKWRYGRYGAGTTVAVYYRKVLYEDNEIKENIIFEEKIRDWDNLERELKIQKDLGLNYKD